MAESEPLEERVWEAGWAAHALAQRRRLAALPLAEKLAWLESAHRLASFLVRPRTVSPTDQDEPRMNG